MDGKHTISLNGFSTVPNGYINAIHKTKESTCRESHINFKMVISTHIRDQTTIKLVRNQHGGTKGIRLLSKIQERLHSEGLGKANEMIHGSKSIRGVLKEIRMGGLGKLVHLG